MLKTSFLQLLLIVGLLTGLWGCGESGSANNEGDSETTETAEPTGPEVVGEEIEYATDSVTMKGYLAYDKNADGPRPAVLVVHEWWGHNDYARSRAEKLAELGYVAFAVDMYGDGKQAAHPDDAGKFAGMVMKNMESAEARFTKAMEVLKSRPEADADQIAAIGYCFGGSVALSMANLGLDLKGVAAFHSGVNLPVQPSEDGVNAKVLVCNGADDPMIKPEDVDNFEQAMENAGVDYEYISYPGAVHAYTNPGADSLGEKFGIPLAYNKEADEKSWAKLQEFLAGIF